MTTATSPRLQQSASKQRVSAAMIVRNEEGYLDDCLKSIAAEVDEIIVVDTGSKDRTCEIAGRYGSRIFSLPWTENFAAARNFALEQASGDWILYIDADERLTVPVHGAVREAVRRPDAVALWVRFQPRMHFTAYREIRLFRRDPRIRFRGVIHETVRPDILKVAESENRTIGTTSIGICHVGYDGNMLAKYRRNLPLLEQAVKANPERVFLWADLAESLAGVGRDDEAKLACRRAIELAAASPEKKQKDDAVLAWRRLIALSNSEPRGALALARTAAAIYPNSPNLQFDLANSLFAAGEFEKVFPILDALIAIDTETFHDPVTAYDKRIFGEWAFDLKGAAYARLGKRAAAAAAFARAADLAPDNRAYRAKAAALSGTNGPPL